MSLALRHLKGPSPAVNTHPPGIAPPATHTLRRPPRCPALYHCVCDITGALQGQGLVSLSFGVTSLGLAYPRCSVVACPGLGVVCLWVGAGRGLRKTSGHNAGVSPSAAHSLVCFSCTNKNSNFYCLKPTICSDSDNYCVTVSASAGIGNVVDFGYTLNKGCSPICPGPSVNLGVASVGTHCCQSFLCNISTADGGLRASAAVLGLGLLLSLLSALLRFGP
uniref:Lymphocyte antigen 6 family member E n=1 Tax=Sus scrofa TaxID=9823 RepID=A0A8D0V4F2_PIG